MTTYITQEQALALAEDAGLPDAASHIKWRGRYNKCTVPEKFEIDSIERLCNAAIQAYRDSLVAGVVLPPMPESDWLLHMPARPYESEWTSHQTGYEACQMENYARQAITDALAKQDARAPMFTFRECEDSQAMKMPDYEQSETYLRTQSELTKPQDHLQEIASFVGVGGYNGATTEQLVERIKAEIERLNVALARQVPQGYKLVPVTPTNDMTVAMANALEDVENERSSWDLAENMYAAMIAAAPDPKEAV